MNLYKISKGIKNVNICGEDINIEHLCFSTNDVKKNSLFFCIEGYKTDGHKFAQKAIENGAIAIVISKDVDVPKNIVKVYVTDTRIAMAIMSDNYYNNPSKKINIIGITGTNGKTTSTYMMKSIMDSYGKKTALLGTIKNIIGDRIIDSKNTTPESLVLHKMFSEMVDDRIDTCIMEVSSHSLALDRVYGMDFSAGIFTNLTQDHLDFHKTMDNYFNTKLKLFENCKNAIINIDDKYGAEAVKLINSKITTYGLSDEADVCAKNIIINGFGSEFDLVYKGISQKVKINLPGKYNIYNALGCAAACLSLDIPMDTIKTGLESIESVIGRSERINTKKGYSIIIDYAHTPDGIENILKTAREYTKKRLIIVFGCGGDRDKTKRPIMGEIAANLADFCVVTSDNPRSEEPNDIISDIMVGVRGKKCDYVVVTNRKEAIKFALDNAQKDDVIVIAGKGHENYQILKDKTIHFDEREIINELLEGETNGTN